MDLSKVFFVIGLLIPLIGLVIPYDTATALILLAAVTAIHELLHWVAARLLGARVKKVALGRFAVSMTVETDSHEKVVAIALAPQIATAFLVYLAVSGVTAAIPVALGHLVMSYIDFKVALRHLRHP